MTVSYKQIAAVNTTIDILEHISNQSGRRTAKEISDDMKIPYGTIMCHISTLSGRGYLNLQGDGISIGTAMAKYWLKKKAESEDKRKIIDQALGLLGGI